MTIMSLAVALVGVAAIPFLPWPAAASWPYIVASGLLHVGYNRFLSRLMDQAISAKPIRSPVVHRRCLLRWVQPYSPASGPICWHCLESSFVCAGIISLAFKAKDFVIAALPAALATGAFIAAYSVVDGIGVRAAGDTLAYAAWMSVLWVVRCRLSSF
jgi:hypothetical protein